MREWSGVVLFAPLGRDGEEAVMLLALTASMTFVVSLTGGDSAEEVAEELGELAHAKPIEYTDPETGWPPAAMKPIHPRPMEG